MLSANHWAEQGGPNGGVRERTEGTEGVCNPIGKTIRTTKAPRVYMEGPLAPAVYVIEDGLVGHQWEKRPLVS